jgi:hypothetical protein
LQLWFVTEHWVGVSAVFGNSCQLVPHPPALRYLAKRASPYTKWPPSRPIAQSQPGFHLLWVREVLGPAERAAIAQPPLDDLIPARHIGLVPGFIDVPVDERHPPVPSTLP